MDDIIKTDRWIIPLYVGLLSTLIVAYFPVLKSLVSFWTNSDEYSHCFIILPIAAYMVWQNKDILTTIRRESSWLNIVPLILTLILYVLTRYMNILTIAALTFPLTIAALTWFLYGAKVFRAAAFPLFFLFLMVPIPNQFYSSITIQLQLIVSKVSAALGAMLGIPILREGNVIHLPGLTLEVVQACSGIRSLITLITLCLIVAYFGFTSKLPKLMIIVSAIPIAVIVNIIRVLLMIFAYHYFQYDLTADPVHTYLGIGVFAMAFGLILMVYKGLLFWKE
jgi:exosortase A